MVCPASSGGSLRLAAGSADLVAALSSGVDRLLPDALPGNPPAAQIDTVYPLTLRPGLTLTLRGSGSGGSAITAWDWTSNRDGPLCAQADCALPADLFSAGSHTITLRVQNTRGLWSAPVATVVNVTKSLSVYLPLVVRTANQALQR